MRLWQIARDVLGLSTLGLALALSVPGVRIASAEPGEIERFRTHLRGSGEGVQSGGAVVEAGPTCQGGAVGAAVAQAELERAMIEVQREVLSRRSPGKHDGDGIVLNNRGYNYRPLSGSGSPRSEPGVPQPAAGE
jgi:hypothetical protein